jgi:hypothetical protein
VYIDDIGDNDVAIQATYHTYFKDFGSPSREKYIQAVHADMTVFSGSVTVDIKTLTTDLATAVPFQEII